MNTGNLCPHRAKLRKDLPPMPSRIAALPIDPERGYPIPFFVVYIDGKPEFRIADGEKYRRCLKDKLCWVCGQPLGSFKSFVIGPMCTVNRISADPPSHLDCALYSVKACPFLLKPQMVRREDGLTKANRGNVAGIMIERNPGVMAVWTTTSYTLERASHGGKGGGGYLFRLAEPDSVSWWREGRTATRSEIMESINTGLPLLREMCDLERDKADAHAELARACEKAMHYLPAA